MPGILSRARSLTHLVGKPNLGDLDVALAGRRSADAFTDNDQRGQNMRRRRTTQQQTNRRRAGDQEIDQRTSAATGPAPATLSAMTIAPTHEPMLTRTSSNGPCLDTAHHDYSPRWHDYDPGWLVALATEQYPDDPWLAEQLVKCRQAWLECPAYLRLRDGRGADGQPLTTNILLTDRREGLLVLDVLKGNRIAGFESVERISEKRPPLEQVGQPAVVPSHRAIFRGLAKLSPRRAGSVDQRPDNGESEE